MMEVASPFAGWLGSLDVVPDPVFAGRMLGDGVAIDPIEGLLRAPSAGRVTTIHAARHAVTIETDSGAVLLVHIGLDTVALAGKGFVAHVAEGDHVATGDPLIGFDLDAVGPAATSLVTPIILTNGEVFSIERIGVDRLVSAGEPILRLSARGPVAAEGSSAGLIVTRSLTVPLRHGIHARPAARIAEVARGYDARVDIVADDGRVASAQSPVALLALALSHGARLTLRGVGADAEAVVSDLADLIASGMGEALPTPTMLQSEPLGAMPSQLRGVTAVPGLAIGKAFTLVETAISVERDAANSAVERCALDDAIARVDERLATSANDRTAGEIANAHRALLADPELASVAQKAISEGRSAAFAWRASIAHFADLLGASGDSRFAERVDDLRDIERSVLAALRGGEEGISVPRGAILLANDLLPSQLIALSDAGLSAIVTARGGPTSHAAIIAAGIGLPMLVAAGEPVHHIENGTSLLLDAGAGTLDIDPPLDVITAFERSRDEGARFSLAAQARAHDEARTLDGARIEVFANLGSLSDARTAIAAGAEGCGLLRTEFLFLDRATAPGENEQYDVYQSIADALGDRPLIVRTLDIGADKPAPYLPMPAEDNPALGLRGLRLGLAQPDILRSQLRALIRVNGPVRIMLPMVSDAAELDATRLLLDQEAVELGRSAPPLGIMVETPAAALLADALAETSAFFSIGSNDLSQYVLARDRGNPAVAAGLDGLHPAVLRLIAGTAKGGNGHGRWTGVCGGLAADPVAVPLLVGLGITELSVPPSAVAVIKARVRTVSLERCRRLAAEAMALRDAKSVRALVVRSGVTQAEAL